MPDLPRAIIEAFTAEDLARLRERLGLEEQAVGYLTARQAGEYLGTSTRRVYQLVREGKVDVYRQGRALRFRASDLDAVMRRGR